MATAADTLTAEHIGQVAGLVWEYIHLNGAATRTKLVKEIDAPRDLVMQAIGWLAREDKILFGQGPRANQIALR